MLDVQGDEAIVQVAEELTSTDEDLDFAALHAPLAPLSTVFYDTF